MLKKKKNATNMLGRVYRKRRRMLQTCWVGYIYKKKKNTTNTGGVYRKRRRMLHTCWVGYIEQEEECYKNE